MTPDVIKDKSIGALIPRRDVRRQVVRLPACVADARAAALRISAFKEAGLDPDKPPTSMDEIKVAAEKLTKRNDKGTITRSGFDLAAPTSFRQTVRDAARLDRDAAVRRRPAELQQREGLETLKWLKSMINNVQPYGQQNAAQQPLV